MHRVNDQFLSYLDELGPELDDPNVELKNVVAVGNLDREINLVALMIGLGLEKAEYEPEQFPGLVYRPTESRCVMLVFASGKVVVTGGKTREEDQEAFDHLKAKVEEFL
nr:TATA-box-binding protein [Halomicroarcula pellucida]